MKNKVLIVGNNAGAYAIAKKLSELHEVFITPESDTLKEFTTVLDIRENNTEELLDFVLENQINLTIVVSQKAIKADIASLFIKNNQPIFAPTQKAGEITYNKGLAKKMFYRLHIPTPKFGIFEKESMAIDYINNQKIPFVIKNNNAQSATIITSVKTAKNIINASFIEKNKKLIVEDYIYGTPFDFYAITDGYKALPIGSSLVYKHSLEGEGGQLTSGMASYTPNYKLSFDDEYFLMDNVIYPTLTNLEESGYPYLGILGINGIKTDDGKLYLLGWNSFLQDADAAGILENLDEDIYSIMESCVIGSFSDEKECINIHNRYLVSLVLKNTNKINKNNILTGIEQLEDETLLTFYPTVKKNNYLEYEIENGPVCILTTKGSTISSASNKIYKEASNICFNGISYRKDIGKILEFA